MENQHKQITGYRDLTQTEIDLMNEAKALAEQCGAFVAKLRGYPGTVNGIPRRHETLGGEPMMLPSLDQRWISIGATDLQRGFMAITRGIAQPTTF
jgi:hypothetical protein